MKITVAGTGYVGLVSGACLAEVGNDVLCLDVDPRKIRILEEGDIPIHEPGLLNVVQRNVEEGKLGFPTSIALAASHSTLQSTAVGTPPIDARTADLQCFLAAACFFRNYMIDQKVVDEKSIVHLGSGEKVKVAIAEEFSASAAQAPAEVVSNPEFLKEGSAFEGFIRSNHIVVAAADEQAKGYFIG